MKCGFKKELPYFHFQEEKKENRFIRKEQKPQLYLLPFNEVQYNRFPFQIIIKLSRWNPSHKLLQIIPP